MIAANRSGLFSLPSVLPSEVNNLNKTGQHTGQIKSEKYVSDRVGNYIVIATDERTF